jgi:hypothetical protein
MEFHFIAGVVEPVQDALGRSIAVCVGFVIRWIRQKRRAVQIWKASCSNLLQNYAKTAALDGLVVMEGGADLVDVGAMAAD